MSSTATPKSSGFLTALVIFLLPLGYLFHNSFNADLTLFSNDGPLAQQLAEWYNLPEGFTGMWMDSNWLGYSLGPATISPASIILAVLGGLYYSKLVVPICLLLLGLSAWVFGRASGFSRGVCILVGLAAMLNMNTVSHGGWGLASRATTQAAIFLALACLLFRRKAIN